MTLLGDRLSLFRDGFSYSGQPIRDKKRQKVLKKRGVYDLYEKRVRSGWMILSLQFESYQSNKLTKHKSFGACQRFAQFISSLSLGLMTD